MKAKQTKLFNMIYLNNIVNYNQLNENVYHLLQQLTEKRQSD